LLQNYDILFCEQRLLNYLEIKHRSGGLSLLKKARLSLLKKARLGLLKKARLGLLKIARLSSL